MRIERLAQEPSHVAREAWGILAKPDRSRPLTDLQRVQGSLRRFGYTTQPASDQRGRSTGSGGSREHRCSRLYV